MIRLLEKEFLAYIPKISFMQTACLYYGFKDSKLAADIWVGENLVVSQQGGRLNITAENCNYEELKEFISVVRFGEIFCEKQTALSLGFQNFDEFSVLKKPCRKTAESDTLIPLCNLYSALKNGEDGDVSLPPFEVFAPDVSHRLRHGGAVALANDEGGALALTCPFGGIISGISVKKEARGMGVGSQLLTQLCSHIEGEVFACTSRENANFYIKNGFEPYGSAVIIRG